MEEERIERGWSVVSEDGKRIGDVVEVHPHYLLVSRGVLVVRDLYVPRYAVAAAAQGKVQLALPADRLRQMGWNTAPPPPPPVDTTTPHLVPPYPFDEVIPDPPLDGVDAAVGATDSGSDLSQLYGDVSPEVDYFPETFSPFLDDYDDIGITYGPTIEVDSGVYLAVQRVGSGPALVCLHGWGLDRRIWDALLYDLPADYTVVTFDARGYGASTGTWSGYDIARAAHDLRVVLRTLDLTEATLLGLDLGAAAALYYHIDGGRRASRLILVNPVVYQQGDEEPGALTAVGTWSADLRRDRSQLATTVAERWAPQSSAQQQAWLASSLLLAAPPALLQGVELLANPPMTGFPELVTLPTTIIQGVSDPLVPIERSQGLAAAIPQADFVALDVPGHLPMVSDPERFIAALRVALSPLHAVQSEALTPMIDDADDVDAPGSSE